MFSSSINDHSFQEVPRNSFRLQCAPKTRHSPAPKSSVPIPGILDMTFNRRSLDWSELQLFSPHSTCTSQKANLAPTQSQSNGDIYQQLSHWCFPPQSSVPPRLVLWGPFNKTEQDHSQFQQPAPSVETYYPSASYPLSVPNHGCKASKRGRDGYLPSACLSSAAPAIPSKRPRTAEHDAYKFPPTPKYTPHQILAYPTPMASPISPSPTFHNNQSLPEESLSISPLSLSPRSLEQVSPTDSKQFYYQDPSLAYPNFPYSQQSYTSSPTCNYGYVPDSPISPTTSLSISPLSINSSAFHASSKNASHQLTLQHPQYPNVWSPEWHQTFNQFRYQNTPIDQEDDEPPKYLYLVTS